MRRCIRAWILVTASVAFATTSHALNSKYLPEPRRAAAAVAVDNALVVIGGATDERPLDSVIALGIGDSDNWSSLPPLNRARMGLAAVKYRGGIVIAGGTDGTSALSDVEHLTNLKGSWIKRPAMSNARSGLALYSMGLSIIAAGGRQAAGITGACEILGFMKNSWKPCNRVPVPTAHPAYAVLNGEAWFIGGIVRRDGKEFTTDAVWIYNPKTDLWRKGPALPFPMSGSGAAVSNESLMGETLWVVGGLDASGAPSARFLRYYQMGNSWVEITNPSMRTCAEAATAIGNEGGIVVIGGRSDDPGCVRAVQFGGFHGSWSAHGGISLDLKISQAKIFQLSPSEPTALPSQAVLTGPRSDAAIIEYEGKPVLLGGADKDRFLNSVEVLQPGGYEWRGMAPLLRARAGLAAATDGKRIITTGGSDQGGPMDYAELYDPETHAWSPIAPMLKARSGHALAWVDNGLVCAMGGSGRDGPDPSAECWDGKIWRSHKPKESGNIVPPVFDAAHVVRKRGEGLAITSLGGRLVWGGAAVLSPSGAFFYISFPDQSRPDFITTALGHSVMPTPRANTAAAGLDNDQYYVAGGIKENGAVSDKLEIHRRNQTTDTWAVASAMPTPRSHATAFFRDRLLFVVGGKDAAGLALNTVETYDPKSNQWASTSVHASNHRKGTPVERAKHPPSTTSYEPETPNIARTLEIPRIKASAASFQNNAVIAGGWLNGRALREAAAQHPETWEWNPISPMKVARGEFGLVAAGGALYAIGGAGNSRHSRDTHRSVERLDNIDGEWGSAPPLTHARRAHGAAALKGTVIACGGVGAKGPLDSCELHTPGTNEWKPAGSLPEARWNFGMASVGDQLYAVGGSTTAKPWSPSDDLLVREASGSWSRGPKLPKPLFHPAVVSLGGRLYVTSGVGPRGIPNGNTYVFDPANGYWWNSRSIGRRSYAAALAWQGQVYVLGGAIDSRNAVTAADSFTPVMPNGTQGQDHGQSHVQMPDSSGDEVWVVEDGLARIRGKEKKGQAMARHKPRPSDVALVIGIERYRRSPSIRYAQEDASSFLETVLALGVPEGRSRLIVGKDASLPGLRKNIEEWLPSLASSDSRVIVYFSGAGTLDLKTGSRFLMPWDGDPKFVDATAYPLGRLYDSLRRLPAREILVVLDAGFSGTGERSVFPTGMRPLVPVRDDVLDPRISVMTAGGVHDAVGSSSESNGGAFTTSLVDAIGGRADADHDGFLTLEEAFIYTRNKVSKMTLSTASGQTPTLTTTRADARLY